MHYQFPPDIEALVQNQLAIGHFHTADDVLRAALAQLEVEDEDVLAIQESLDLLEQGDEGIPLKEAFDSIRQKYDIPADA